MSKILLISGSRIWQPHLMPRVKARVQAAVRYAKAQGYTLYVGDAPGVDALAVACAGELGVSHVIHGRHKIRVNDVSEPASINTAFDSYPERDEFMVFHADFVYCLWNGSSKDTSHVWRYAQSLNKEGWLEEIKETT